MLLPVLAAAAFALPPSPLGLPARAPALTASIGRVSCPSRQVPVVVVNGTDRALGYDLYSGYDLVRTEQVPSNRTIDGRVQLAEDEPTMLTVRSGGATIASARRTANCRAGSGGAGGARAEGPSSRLPHTGPGLNAGVLTALGGLAAGGVLLFWGRLWPGSGRGDWAAPTRRG
ncbi:hypothetical protein [Actinomadura parmotrematis]|uniref:Uncharacterized protein n=1 Tax=Actinomadura parmotrematis TaxID=2864039 RepID=A0ABS7FU64_9ACTN|nr:hypothetical protein [Actinomadura parmotrematis]MBW8483856.1 hypothetical protein [Actinomadura parmotrematis]